MSFVFLALLVYSVIWLFVNFCIFYATAMLEHAERLSKQEVQALSDKYRQAKDDLVGLLALRSEMEAQK